MQTQPLAGSVALVTGAGSGIGRASAVMLAQHGARVAIADRDMEGAETTRASIAAAGGDAITIQVEIADSASVDRMVQACIQSLGHVDVLVHCAAILKIVPIIETSNEDWHRVIGVNLDGTFYASRAAARVMAAQGSGQIILITSGRGVSGAKLNAAYASSKGGVNAFTLSLAREVESLGIMVNAVDPGQTDTPLQRSVPSELHATPLTEGKRSRKPEDVAEVVLFLATNTASITGQILQVRMRR